MHPLLLRLGSSRARIRRPSNRPTESSSNSIIPTEKAATRLPHAKRSAQGDPTDQPLHLADIDAAANDALRLSQSQDEMALTSASRECHHLLRSEPSLVQLDRCAAFDDAVVQLQDRDPLRDQGPFSELVVTGRLWSGATALSNDSVAIDGRLDRIRLRVEIALASVAQPGGSN
jgi:hypothetical protein